VIKRSTMQYFAVTRRRTEQFADAEFQALVEQERAQARVLYAEGFVRQLWHRGDVPGACLLIEADSEEQARERLDTLPLMRAGMLDVVVIPLKPYAGFCPPRQ